MTPKLPRCSRCQQLNVDWPASYVFDVEKHQNVSVVYMYLCAACHGSHSLVTQERYKHV